MTEPHTTRAGRPRRHVRLAATSAVLLLSGAGLLALAGPASAQFAPPTVTGVSPSSGPDTGGTTVVLTGTNFQAGCELQPVTGVYFGTTDTKNFTINSNTMITVVAPAHAAGTVDVTVTAPLCPAVGPNPPADQYTYTSTPAEQLAALYQAVQGVGTGNSLTAQVSAAQAALARGNVTATCNDLTLFISTVQAQSGKSIPPTTASELIADAQNIQAALSC